MTLDQTINVITIIASSSAIIISLIALRQTNLQNKRNNEIEERQLLVEVDNKLHEAWLLLGGNIGTETISVIVSEADANLAKRLITEAEILKPNYAPIYRHFGSCYSQKRDLKNAVKNFKKSIKLDPKCGASYNGLGVIYSRFNENDLAIEYYEKSIKLNPDNYLAYNNMGVLYLRQKNYGIALKYLQKSIELNSKSDLSFYNLGNLYTEQGEYKLAIENYNSALEIKPEHREVKQNLKFAKMEFEKQRTTK